VDGGLGSATDGREPSLREEPREAALMTAYIITGVVALLVTLYLFAALLFPERF
jgi:K+-transporting ATPase KdpF subunit